MKTVLINRKDVRAMIFDLDGVITQTAKVHNQAWKQMFNEYLEKYHGGIDAYDKKQDYDEYIDGKPRYDGVRSFLKSRKINLPYGSPDDPAGAETICGLGNRKNDIFLKLIQEQGVDVYDDAVEQVRKWKNIGLKTAVVSSSKNCKEVLQAAGIQKLFEVRVDGVVAYQKNLKGKPQPDIFLQAASDLNVEPGSALVFEDAIAGVQAGQAGGFMHVVGVARHGQDEILAKNGADIVIQNLNEIQVMGEKSEAKRLQ